MKNKTFLNASLILITFILILLVSAVALYRYSNVQFYNLLALLLILMLIITAVMIGLSVVFTLAAGKRGYPVKSRAAGLSSWVMRVWLVPLLKFIAELFKLDTEKIDKFYIEFNNSMVTSSAHPTISNTNLVLLLPHCLQNKSCQYKITHDTGNCRRCGRCDIGSLVELCEKWKVKCIVVTGGTAARAELERLRPAAAVSVACERDLSSGIRDVGKIPVIGVLNTRPEGPCCNTRVNLDEVEESIRQFIGSNVNYLAGSTSKND